jgi:AcrR family transcriptional regulator
VSIETLLKCTRPGRPKVVSDEDQCAVILNATREIFLAKGYDKMTMDDVAAKAGMSKKTLYRLFKDGKTALFIGFVEAHRAEMVALPGDYDHLSLEEALAKIFHVDIETEEDFVRMSVLKMIKVEAAKSPEVLAFLKEHVGERSLSLLEEWLQHQVDMGRIRPCDCRNAARILLDMIFGAIIKKGGQLCEWPDQAERSTYMRQCIDIFVNGCNCKEKQ